MISHTRDQDGLSIILFEFVFFGKIGKNCFDDKHGILDLKTWCLLLYNIFIYKYMPNIVW